MNIKRTQRKIVICKPPSSNLLTMPLKLVLNIPQDIQIGKDAGYFLQSNSKRIPDVEDIYYLFYRWDGVIITPRQMVRGKKENYSFQLFFSFSLLGFNCFGPAWWWVRDKKRNRSEHYLHFFSIL